MRWRWTWLAAALAAVPAVAQFPAVPTPGALEPASTGGLETVDRALAKLSSHRRLLVVGAHPDDEDNSVLAWVSRGVGGEAAYLALSRGEGGQNLIGPELGVGLGLIRTGELLAARRVEGSRQLFARAYDFGYTRSLEETGRRWPRATLLEDAVRAARRFKPQVVVSVFPPDRRAGHGQHQMAGVIARALYESSGEPDRFPELTAAGLPPWSPEALYRRAWSREEATLGFSLAAIEPLSGRSLGQIAAASRSLHRSQDMGREQRLGGGRSGLVWIAGGAGAAGSEPFAGIDTRLAAIAGTLPPGGAREELGELLERVESRARRAHARLGPRTLDAAVPDLAAIVAELRAALGLTGREGAAADLVGEKLAVAAAGLAAAAGVAVEASASRESVLPGASLPVEVGVWNAGAREVSAAEVRLSAPAQWAVNLVASPEPGATAPGRAEPAGWRFEAVAPAAAAPSLPYFLRSERGGDLYDWSGAAAAVRGEPWEPPLLSARLRLRIEGVEVELEREVVYRYGDQAVGEVRRPLRVVPALEVAPSPTLVLWRRGVDAEKELEIGLLAHGERRLEGSLEVAFDGGFRTEGAARFSLGGRGGSGALRLRLLPTDSLAPGTFAGTVSAVLDSGERFAAAYPVIEYPHVRPVAMRLPARLEVRVLDLELPRLSRIGYVRGASDRVPELLREVGLPVTLLGAGELANGDLARYDAIVVGSRAYETDPLLERSNDRLLEYARGGGLLLVQYQQYQFVRGGFAPFPLDIARPHGRVTDESSPVTMLDPAHAVFNRPNPIGPADWQGWVSERGLYFADGWDAAYTPLLELRDPGQPPQRGALLVARVGEGWYVYTGLSFFRELPAGVPGAFRLFANLLALGAE